MRALIVEDDFTSRLILQKLLESFGDCHIAVNGKEAVFAFGEAWKAGQPYDLICLDIMMPEMDGQTALKELRNLENGWGIPWGQGAKIVMTTVLGDMKNIFAAYRELCEGYLTKPIDKARLTKLLEELKLVPQGYAT